MLYQFCKKLAASHNIELIQRYKEFAKRKNKINGVNYA